MKLRKAVLQHRADPLPIRETINRDNNGEEGASAGLSSMGSTHSSKRCRKSPGSRSAQRARYCGLLRPAFDLKWPCGVSGRTLDSK